MDFRGFILQKGTRNGSGLWQPVPQLEACGLGTGLTVAGIYACMGVCSVTQSCLTLCDPMDF